MFFGKAMPSILKDNHISNEIEALTSLRFLIAFIVFLFHFRIHLGFSVGIKIIDKFIVNGAVFMSAFFVLSGYIMSYVYQNKDFSKKSELFSFYLKRFAKIYPVYFVATIAFFAFVTPPAPYVATDWLRIVMNDFFLTQAFFPNMFKMGINGGTWSISVEAFFYLLFPLIVLLFAKRPYTLLFIGLFLSLLINVNILSEVSVGEVTNTFYPNPTMRVNEFIIGIAFYLLGSKGALDKIPKPFKSALFVFLIIFALTCLKQSQGNYYYMGLHFFIIPLLGLFIFCCHHTNSGPMRNSKALNYLGKISYSFYMWQFIAVHLGLYLKTKYELNLWYVTGSMLLFNIIISALSYHFIEEKFRKVLIRRFNLKRQSSKNLQEDIVPSLP